MDPHVIVTILSGIGIKYLINFASFLEDIAKVDLPNLGKQAAVVLLAYVATKIPQIAIYLPQITAWLQVALVAVIATLSHHLIELVVAWQHKLGG